ncbi:MAG: hypothetical protein HOL08_11425 [Opitutae bacterium]|nr:hypothetical protein [Opitutae bacterium]
MVIGRTEQIPCHGTTIYHIECAFGWFSLDLLNVKEATQMIGQDMGYSFVLTLKTDAVRHRNMKGFIIRILCINWPYFGDKAVRLGEKKGCNLKKFVGPARITYGLYQCSESLALWL